MKKLFISQPMKGKTDDEILAEREKAIKSAERQLGEPVEVIDSFFQSAPADAKPLWFLGKSLELLSGADIAYFAKGWQEARGCKIENTCAIEYGIAVIEDYTAEQKGGDPDISQGQQGEVAYKQALGISQVLFLYLFVSRSDVKQSDNRGSHT